MDHSLKNKVVIITGATSPIGQRLVAAFAETGARLALCVRRVSEVDSTERPLLDRGISAMALPCDLRYEEDVVRTVHRIVRRFGSIDTVVNAATVTGPRVALVDYPVDPWRNVLSTNVTGAYLICREVLPWMSRQGYGSIINVISSVAASGRSEWGAYFISSQALDGMTRMLAAEYKGSGIRINAVEIGTPAQLATLDRTPDSWTDAFLWLAGEQSATTTGQRLRASDFVRPAEAVRPN